MKIDAKQNRKPHHAAQQTKKMRRGHPALHADTSIFSVIRRGAHLAGTLGDTTALGPSLSSAATPSPYGAWRVPGCQAPAGGAWHRDGRGRGGSLGVAMAAWQAWPTDWARSLCVSWPPIALTSLNFDRTLQGMDSPSETSNKNPFLRATIEIERVEKVQKT